MDSVQFINKTQFYSTGAVDSRLMVFDQTDLKTLINGDWKGWVKGRVKLMSSCFTRVLFHRGHFISAMSKMKNLLFVFDLNGSEVKRIELEGLELTSILFLDYSEFHKALVIVDHWSRFVCLSEDYKIERSGVNNLNLIDYFRFSLRN